MEASREESSSGRSRRHDRRRRGVGSGDGPAARSTTTAGRRCEDSDDVAEARSDLLSVDGGDAWASGGTVGPGGGQ
jgi:hypothetical protein